MTNDKAVIAWAITDIISKAQTVLKMLHDEAATARPAARTARSATRRNRSTKAATATAPVAAQNAEAKRAQLQELLAKGIQFRRIMSTFKWNASQTKRELETLAKAGVAIENVMQNKRQVYRLAHDAKA